jgi:hypothetical protein
LGVHIIKLRRSEQARGTFIPLHELRNPEKIYTVPITAVGSHKPQEPTLEPDTDHDSIWYISYPIDLSKEMILGAVSPRRRHFPLLSSHNIPPVRAAKNITLIIRTHSGTTRLLRSRLRLPALVEGSYGIPRNHCNHDV